MMWPKFDEFSMWAAREANDDPRKFMSGLEAERAHAARIPAQYKTAEFKALAKEWDKKLAADGFEDAEADQRDGKNLYGPWGALYALDSARTYANNQHSLTADLFTMMSHWMDRARWRTRRERQFFYCRAQGDELRDTYDRHPARQDDMVYRSFVESQLRMQHDMLDVNLAEIDEEQAAELVAEDRDPADRIRMLKELLS
jgi:hypothetical protein